MQTSCLKEEIMMGVLWQCGMRDVEEEKEKTILGFYMRPKINSPCWDNHKGCTQ